MKSQTLEPIISAAADQALVSLLGYLREQDYHFITTTPLTHQRVYSRRQSLPAETLQDIFGWNLPFNKNNMPSALIALMDEAGILLNEMTLHRSALRVSSIGDTLFIHSGFPTDHENTVFFGPDTYRFVNFLRYHLIGNAEKSDIRLLDVGCGSGAGGLMAAQYCNNATLTMTDINPEALRHTAINAAAAGIPLTLALGDALAAATGNFDIIISNPPYLSDAHRRAYRHGGERLGRALSVRIATEAINRLAQGGRLLLYTGVAIVNGRDYFIEELTPALATANCDWEYQELDPDVFGEELEHAAYHGADRIAAVGLVARKR